MKKPLTIPKLKKQAWDLLSKIIHTSGTLSIGDWKIRDKDEIADEILELVKQEIVEEIEKKLNRVLRVSNTADDYHIGIAYVIDTFLKSANIKQTLNK